MRLTLFSLVLLVVGGCWDSTPNQQKYVISQSHYDAVTSPDRELEE